MLIKEARKGERAFNPAEMKAQIAAQESAKGSVAGKAKGLAEKFGKLSTGKKAGILGAAAAALAGTAYAAKKLGSKKES